MRQHTEAINDIVSALVSGNNDFLQGRTDDYFKLQCHRQHPFITMVTCSDSRVHPQVVMSDAIDKIFTIKNIGNQIATSAGSVDYGILHLKTPLLLILGHTCCGAIGAFLNGYENEPDTIKRELDRLGPALKEIAPAAPSEDILLEGTLLNIEYQVAEAVNRYRPLVEDYKLTVMGAVYDISNQLGNGHGCLTFTAINNGSDVAGIHALEFGHNVLMRRSVQ